MKRYLTLKPLTNGSTHYPAGSVVEFDDPTAKWCVDLGVIDPNPITDEAAVATRTPPAAVPTPSAPARRGCAGCGWR